MQTENKKLSGLIKRLLGLNQTPCTVLSGEQYSWPIPLERCLTDSEPITWASYCPHRFGYYYIDSGTAISAWLGSVDRPTVEHKAIQSFVHATHYISCTQAGGGRYVP